MPTIGRVLSKHNTRVSKSSEEIEPPAGCNCRGGPTVCPLEGSCLTRELVYQATVVREDNDQMETYTGLTGGTFKDRFYKHMSDFRNEELESSTGLSKYIWKLKRENIPHKVTWKKLARARVFNPGTKTCQLCLKEKYLIMFSPQGATLNDRNELYNTCRHRLKELLKNTKT